ncbi:cupin domain-containing protein [Streptomyces sp. NPDC020096]
MAVTGLLGVIEPSRHWSTGLTMRGVSSTLQKVSQIDYIVWRNDMPLSTGAAAAAFERDGFTFRPLAVPSRGSSELAVWSLELAPGAASERHRMDREEVFVVVSGQIAASVGGEEVAAGPGDAIIVPADTELLIRNACTVNPATATAVTSVGMKATVGGATFSPPWAQ